MKQDSKQTIRYIIINTLNHTQLLITMVCQNMEYQVDYQNLLCDEFNLSMNELVGIQEDTSGEVEE